MRRGETTMPHRVVPGCGAMGWSAVRCRAATGHRGDAWRDGIRTGMAGVRWDVVGMASSGCGTMCRGGGAPVHIRMVWRHVMAGADRRVPGR
ncbi:hypothetical protein GUJ93_ZPchr0002g26212 [Zizania palustris]|uniref:Uncharacterized protein n=1 Tax=Zizania palustris TaxID=103762 RepID=A0A8J5SCB7_ZIZPA|nr:hypothetical protein GUJ93_ZPchr0002g26212 [Zizania palustris]